LVLHEGPPSDAEYGALRSVVIKTHERCERDGVEFEQHVAAHDCGVSTNEYRLAAAAHASASASIGTVKQKAISA
jgi:hypothetical protein